MKLKWAIRVIPSGSMVHLASFLDFSPSRFHLFKGIL